jgi:hypothetical protein
MARMLEAMQGDWATEKAQVLERLAASNSPSQGRA